MKKYFVLFKTVLMAIGIFACCADEADVDTVDEATPEVTAAPTSEPSNCISVRGNGKV